MKQMHSIPHIILLTGLLAGSASSATCLAPQRPYIPNDPVFAKRYTDLIRQDFEDYIRYIQQYFQCLDTERARAFIEAREVSQDYGDFNDSVGGE